MLPPLLPYNVTRNEFITTNVIQIDCVPTDGERIAFRAGQFMMLHWLDEHGELIDIPHAYSIASAPHENGFSFCIKIYGPYTTRLSQEVRPGTTIHLKGPYGLFTLQKVEDQTVVMLAGGVGIAPFRGMIYDELVNRSGSTQINTQKDADAPVKRFHVLYSNKTKASFPYMQELDEWAASYPDRLKLTYTITQDGEPDWGGRRGRWTAESIKEEVRGWEAATYFVCGPPPFVTEMQDQLKGMGIALGRVKVEKFT